MDLAAPHPLPLGRARDWPALARDGALMGFFVALACSISASQGLLALLCVLVLVAPGVVGRPARIGARAAVASAAAPWTDLASLRRHPLTPPFLGFAGLTLLSAAFSGNPGWSFWIARDLLRIATFYLVLLYTRDSRHALRLWQAFLAVLSLMAAYGLAQVYLCGTRPPWVPGAWLGRSARTPSVFADPSAST